MLRSMFSAVSGLRAHQTKMDVVGNNIANVNTVGFKSSQTVFEDTLSQVARNGVGPDGATGGSNPAQVGLGVSTAAITTNFSQGNAQETSRAEDFMITGDGFFVAQDGAQQVYSRAGSMSLDGQGRFVTPSGNILQGWIADAAGVVNTNAGVGPLSIPIGQAIAAVPTSTATLTGNLPAGDPVGKVRSLALTTYDAQGLTHDIAFTATKTGDGAWTLQASEGDAALGTQQLTFDTAGRLTAPQPATFGIATTTGGTIAADLTGFTNYGGTSTFAATQQNGSGFGSLQSFSVNPDGTILGAYTNGVRKAVGQVALATFANPGGLEKGGESTYRAGVNSGVAQIGVANEAGRGKITAGQLEMSNVDLAEEFTGLIIAQRGFQANSKVITASDELLSDLVNLKR